MIVVDYHAYIVGWKMKRALLLVFIVIIGLVAFLIGKGYLLTSLDGSTIDSVLQVLFQDGVTSALLIITLVLFALLLYSGEITQGYRRLQRAVTDGDTKENQTETLTLSQRFEFTEKALRDFAGAMQIYAGHLASHTSAIQGLSQASQALRISTAEQNRILRNLDKSIIGRRVSSKTTTMGKLVDEIEEKTERALRAYDSLKHGTPEYLIDEIPVKKQIESPPGCVINPKALQARLRH
jgi:hypothetical protein